MVKNDRIRPHQSGGWSRPDLGVLVCVQFKGHMAKLGHFCFTRNDFFIVIHGTIIAVEIPHIFYALGKVLFELPLEKSSLHPILIYPRRFKISSNLEFVVVIHKNLRMFFPHI